MSSSPWYSTWFDSDYYYRLYDYRNESEAATFVDALLSRIPLDPGDQVIDLACGRGRYSRLLAERGLSVTGLDLSSSSIQEAQQSPQPNQVFFQHDMLRPFPTNEAAAVFNFFTSFGYFDSDQQNIQVLHNVVTALKAGGYFVLDFLNIEKATQTQRDPVSLERDGVNFLLSWEQTPSHLIKQIQVKDGLTRQTFKENLQLLKLSDFERFFDIVGLELGAVYGDYSLRLFDPTSSERLILIAHKPA